MSIVYNFLCKQTSTYVVGIFASTFIFERSFDLLAEGLFESHNKGVSVLDVAHNLDTSLHNNNISFSHLTPSHRRNCGRTSSTSTNRGDAAILR